jgi:hypothetical protein
MIDSINFLWGQVMNIKVKQYKPSYHLGHMLILILGLTAHYLIYFLGCLYFEIWHWLIHRIAVSWDEISWLVQAGMTLHISSRNCLSLSFLGFEILQL